MAKNAPASGKQILITVSAAVVAVSLLAYVVSVLHERTGRHGMRGVIIDKEFIPLEETQITIGGRGVTTREVKGEYKLTVRVEESGREYVVWVDERAFRQHKEGDPYFFLRPPPEPPRE